MIVHYDCRHFMGYKPCIHHRECEACPHSSAIEKRILIIKLSAMGDVLRTTALLAGVRDAYPGCHITWLTKATVMPMLQGIPEIDRLLPYTYERVLQLENER